MEGKLLQTDPRLDPAIRKWGCYYLSLLGCIQDEAESLFTSEQINSMYITHRDTTGALDMECTITSKLKAIFILGFETLLTLGEGYQVGYRDNYNLIYWSPNLKNYNYIIKLVKSQYGDHYVQCDSHGLLIYDPYPLKRNITYTKDWFYKVIAIK